MTKSSEQSLLKVSEQVAISDLKSRGWTNVDEFVEPDYLKGSSALRSLKVANLREVLTQYKIQVDSRELKANMVKMIANELLPLSDSIKQVRRRTWQRAAESKAYSATPKTKVDSDRASSPHHKSPRKLQQHVKFYMLRYRRVFFSIGVFTGVLLTMLFKPFPDFKDIATQSLMNLFPKIDLMALDDEFEPGSELVQKLNLSVKHPVVLVPGIVSTGLEVWNSPFDYETKKVNKFSSSNQTETRINDAKREILLKKKECAAKYFRKRLWGTLNQFRAVLMDRDCWLAHMMLDPETGLDPAGVRMRAAQGLEAADYLYPGYWVWAKVIANLATLGYDSTTMHFASYDWRLAPQATEERDMYFSRLKTTVELLVKSSNEKAVIIAHSMGSNMFLHFLSWIRETVGTGWLDSHMHRFVNVGGPLLGVPKSVSSFLSGEMRDTAQMNRLATYIVDMFLSRQERAQLFRSWLGSASMLPKGGNVIWGSYREAAPDDLSLETPANLSIDSSTRISSSTKSNPFLSIKAYIQPDCPFGNSILPSLPELNTFFAETANETEDWNWKATLEQLDALQVHNKSESFLQRLKNLFIASSNKGAAPVAQTLEDQVKSRSLPIKSSPCVRNVTEKGSSTCQIMLDATDMISLLKNTTGPYFGGHLSSKFSYDIAYTREQVLDNRKLDRKWGNPLEVDLPELQNSTFKIYCIYGIGKVTERGYHYKAWNREMPRDDNETQWRAVMKTDDFNETVLKLNKDTEFAIDTDYTDVKSRVLNGIVASDGDGTVPLVSLGYMCRKGWKMDRYNSGKIPVVTREYRDQSSDTTMTLRGGENSGDHVDIMGNYGLLKDILLIVSGKDESLEDQVLSRISEISDNVSLE